MQLADEPAAVTWARWNSGIVSCGAKKQGEVRIATAATLARHVVHVLCFTYNAILAQSFDTGRALHAELHCQAIA